MHDQIIKTQKKNKKRLKDEIIRDDEIWFELEKDYYDLTEIESAFDRNFIKSEFNRDKDKTSVLHE